MKDYEKAFKQNVEKIIEGSAATARKGIVEELCSFASYFFKIFKLKDTSMEGCDVGDFKVKEIVLQGNSYGNKIDFDSFVHVELSYLGQLKLGTALSSSLDKNIRQLSKKDAQGYYIEIQDILERDWNSISPSFHLIVERTIRNLEADFHTVLRPFMDKKVITQTDLYGLKGEKGVITSNPYTSVNKSSSLSRVPKSVTAAWSVFFEGSEEADVPVSPSKVEPAVYSSPREYTKAIRNRVQEIVDSSKLRDIVEDFLGYLRATANVEWTEDVDVQEDSEGLHRLYKEKEYWKENKELVFPFFLDLRLYLGKVIFKGVTHKGLPPSIEPSPVTRIKGPSGKRVSTFYANTIDLITAEWSSSKKYRIPSHIEEDFHQEMERIARTVSNDSVILSIINGIFKDSNITGLKEFDSYDIDLMTFEVSYHPERTIHFFAEAKILHDFSTEPLSIEEKEAIANKALKKGVKDLIKAIEASRKYFQKIQSFGIIRNGDENKGLLLQTIPSLDKLPDEYKQYAHYLEGNNYILYLKIGKVSIVNLVQDLREVWYDLNSYINRKAKSVDPGIFAWAQGDTIRNSVLFVLEW